MLVPLPPFAPDQSVFSPQASTEVLNAHPTKDGWGPMRAITALSAAIGAEPRGGVAVKSNAGTWKIFVGTAVGLYEIDSSDYTWIDRTNSGGAYTLADRVFWDFEHWGDNIIATAVGSDYPQIRALGSAGLFSDLANATFEAAKVWTAGDFLCFGGIDGINNKIKHSAINDETGWTPGVDGSDEQTLPDGGNIQGAINQSSDAIIFQETKIRRMQFDPVAGSAFGIPIINPDRGAFAPRSIVNIGANDFVFLSNDGFYRGAEATPIGAERVDRWFFSQCDPSKYALVSGYRDPYEKHVMWRFEDNSSTNHIIGYDWQLDRWFTSDMDVQEIFAAATTGYTLDQLNAFGTLDALPYSLDSRAWQGGIPGLGGMSAQRFGFFDGTNLEVLLATEDKGLAYPRRATTGRIRVLVDTDDAQVAISSKELQEAQPSYGDYLSRESGQNFINSRVGGRWHRFKIRVPAETTWSSATAIDVAFVDGGDR